MAKDLRESVGATHIIIYAVMPDGEQCVATSGGTAREARQAADAGNKFKTALGWPEDLCKDRPAPRLCKNCAFWKVDRGIFTATGWTGDGDRGWCHLEPKEVRKSADSLCHYFEVSE